MINNEHYTLYFPKIDAIAYTTCYNPSNEKATFHIDDIIHNPERLILKREGINFVYASRKHRGMDFDVYMENPKMPIPLPTVLNDNPIILKNYIKFQSIHEKEEVRQLEQSAEEEGTLIPQIKKKKLEGGKKSRKRKSKRSKKTRRSRR